MARPRRNCRIEIDASALRHNLARVRELAPGCKVMPVIKAEAYGHGMATAMHAFDTADACAVAMIGEGLRLRELGCDKPVVVFHGFADAAELALCAEHDLQPALHQAAQLELIASWQGAPLDVWLKLDTGMHRLGLPLADAAAAW